MNKKQRTFTEKEAALYGRRMVCFESGHILETTFEMLYSGGGVQMQYDRGPNDQIATCDTVKCTRCDAIITVTYPEIGTIVTP
jgi:hypothetical protein